MKAMRKMWIFGLTAWLGLAGNAAESDDARTWPPFQQVLESIEANLPELDRDELNAVIVQSLLDHYYPRVTLVPSGDADAESAPSTSVVTTVFDSNFGYLRIGTVARGLDRQLAEEWTELRSGHQLKGLVLDLRFADGQDYETAAYVANLFITTNQPLLAWQDTVVHATPIPDTIVPPLVVLVNQRSSGAAEALAAALRESGAALLVGTRTAGQAYVFRDVELPEGRLLRVAAEPVRVGDGKSIAGGLIPDIEVIVSVADERKYLADPYAVIPGAVAGTALRAERSQINEAELMRQRQPGARQGFPLAPERAGPPARLEDPVVQDPALARGLDLLKGIAIVGRAR
jgi:hypothetical protein